MKIEGLCIQRRGTKEKPEEGMRFTIFGSLNDPLCLPSLHQKCRHLCSSFLAHLGTSPPLPFKGKKEEKEEQRAKRVWSERTSVKSANSAPSLRLRHSSTMSAKVVCPSHPDAALIEDHRAGDMICSACGLVVGDRVIDVGSEWRTFSNEKGSEDR